MAEQTRKSLFGKKKDDEVKRQELPLLEPQLKLIWNEHRENYYSESQKALELLLRESIMVDRTPDVEDDRVRRQEFVNIKKKMEDTKNPGDYFFLEEKAEAINPNRKFIKYPDRTKIVPEGHRDKVKINLHKENEEINKAIGELEKSVFAAQEALDNLTVQSAKLANLRGFKNGINGGLQMGLNPDNRETIITNFSGKSISGWESDISKLNRISKVAAELTNEVKELKEAKSLGRNSFRIVETK